MAKQMPKKAEDSGGDWLNTYADMVTLLLTFFVLLFCCSNLDETKMQFILQAFKSRGKYVNQVVDKQDTLAQNSGGVTDSLPEGGGEGTMPQSFQELYMYLVEYTENADLTDSITVEEGASHLTIRFDNSVFFDGNSYILKPEGRKVLNGIIPGIKAVEKSIYSMTISGHTARAVSDVNDFQLSSLRACSVQLHLENNDTVDPSKYRVKGSGPNEPLADNTDPAKERRVEITIIKNELDPTDKDVMMDILMHDFGVGSGAFDPDKHTGKDPQNLPDGSADKIIGLITDKFNGSATHIGSFGPDAVDGSQFVVSSGDDKGGDKAEASAGDE
ncbi:MAG: flagellar motor protein MotB [Oscillospiraceae bacterium]